MEKAIYTRSKFQAIIFPVLDVLLNGGNLAIHIYISWYLTSGDYGILNAYFSLLFVLMIFGMAIQTYFAKIVSQTNFSKNTKTNFIVKMNQMTNVVIIGITSIMIIIIYPMTQLLRGQPHQYLMMLSIFIIQARVSYYRGYLQGQKKFLKLNSSFYIEMGAKLLLLIPLLHYYRSIESILVSVLAGMMASLIVTKKAATLTSESHNQNIQFKLNIKEAAKNKSSFIPLIKGFSNVLSTQVFFYYFTAITLILANYYIGEKSGVYAVSARYGQIFIHIGLSIITVLIPYTSEVKDNQQAFKKKVTKLLGLYTLIGTFILIAYAVAMPMALKLLFSPVYYGARTLILPHAAAYFMLSISFFMASMEMVAGDKDYIKTLVIFSLMLLIALMKWNNTLEQIVTIELVTYTLMALVLVLRFLTRRIKK